MNPVNAPDHVRDIDRGALPTRFARGWHCLGLADSFRDGKPHAIEAFGTKLVVWADSTGRLHVLDGYCRHMGGDLTQGTVKGDEVACPFHDWRWGGDGKCKAIPYAKRIPLRARTRTWRAMEENQQLFVYNDPEGNPPPAEVAIPRIDAAFDDQWTDWTWNTLFIENANCREIIDNVVDMAHFFYIHYAFPTYFKNVECSYLCRVDPRIQLGRVPIGPCVAAEECPASAPAAATDQPAAVLDDKIRAVAQQLRVDPERAAQRPLD